MAVASNRQKPAVQFAGLVAAAVLVTVGLVPYLATASPLSPLVATKLFSGGFQPGQVVAANGMIWLEGAYGTGCLVGQLNPATMTLATYPIAQCGGNVTTGGGALFIEVSTPNVKSNTYAIRIERFSTVTHTATVLPVVSARLFLGSDIAHTQLAYADGSLWFYGVPEARNAPEVLQLSPATGAVEHAYLSVPQIGGTEPIIAGVSRYVWLAGGAGSGSDFLRIDVQRRTVLAVNLSARYASVYDLVAANGQLYFAYFETSPGTTSAVSLTRHVAHLSPSGAIVARSPNEQVGSWLVGLGGRLFSVGPNSSCTSGLDLWSINEETLRSTLVAHLKAPGNTCTGESIFRSVATVHKAVFELYDGEPSAVLYRVTRL